MCLHGVLLLALLGLAGAPQAQEKLTLVRTIDLPDVSGRIDHLAVDRSGGRVFIADTTSGKRVGSLPIVGDTDGLFYDAARKRLYVTGGEGYIDVVQQTDPDHLTRIARVASAAGPRTSLFVPDQNRLYLAVPRRLPGQKAEIRVYDVRD